MNVWVLLFFADTKTLFLKKLKEIKKILKNINTAVFSV